MTEPTLKHPTAVIRRAKRSDLAAIQAIYADARELQRQQSIESWPDFPPDEVVRQIDRGYLYCVVDGRAIAGVFTIAYDDRAIWGERERGDHVYLHRIAKARDSRVSGFLDRILRWASDHCRTLGRVGLRMDTWASNAALISLYESRGFQQVDRVHIGYDERLPPQYHENDFVLLEQT